MYIVYQNVYVSKYDMHKCKVVGEYNIHLYSLYMKNGTFLDFTTVVESNVIIFKYISCRHVMTVAEVFYVK
jgi:hypothetical protein